MAIAGALIKPSEIEEEDEIRAPLPTAITPTSEPESDIELLEILEDAPAEIVCPSCGSQVETGTTFCPHCGSQL